MKRLIYLAAVLCMVFSCSLQAGTYSGGDGSEGNPYKIATAADMQEIGTDSNDWDDHFVMTADVNLAQFTGTQFNLINFFTGVFDGNGHSISNFSYSSSSIGGIALFRVADTNAVVKNLLLIDPNIIINSVGDTVSSLVGGLAGRIQNCGVVGGSVTGFRNIGGLVGYLGGSATISNCFSTASVSGDDCVGGLVGFSEPAEISNCYASGPVSGNSSVGGLVGADWHGGVANCYAAGPVSGNSAVGALIGAGGAGYEYNPSFWDSDINPDIDGVGNNESSSGVIGKTTMEMMTEDTFTDAGWDFIDVWNIGENQTYPYIRVYPAGDLNHNGVVNMPDFSIFAGHWQEGSTPLTPVAEVQTMTCNSTATAGTFSLTYEGQMTAAISYDANLSQIQAALEALSTVDTGDITVGGSDLGSGGSLSFTFDITLGDVSMIIIDDSALIGASPVVIVETTKGVSAN